MVAYLAETDLAEGVALGRILTLRCDGGEELAQRWHEKMQYP